MSILSLNFGIQTKFLLNSYRMPSVRAFLVARRGRRRLLQLLLLLRRRRSRRSYLGGRSRALELGQSLHCPSHAHSSNLDFAKYLLVFGELTLELINKLDV